MQTADEEAMMDIFRESPDIQAAEERYRRFLADPQLQSMYRARERGRMVQASREGYARSEGIEEGIKRGLRKGKAEGKAEGRRESVAEVARRMKGMGLDFQVIATATGLSEAEIREI